MRLDDKTILFQGDSITDMARGRNPDDLNHIYGHSFVFLIASRLGCEMPEKKITIYNRGISGNTSGDILARWDEDAVTLKPDVINLLCGINDIIRIASRGENHTAEEYAQNLMRIVRLTKAELPFSEFIICEPFASAKAVEDTYKAVFDEQIPLYQAASKTVAAELGCKFIPLQEEFNRVYKEHPELDENYWLWDGIHPTAAGQYLIAKKWLSVI